MLWPIWSFRYTTVAALEITINKMVVKPLIDTLAVAALAETGRVLAPNATVVLLADAYIHIADQHRAAHRHYVQRGMAAAGFGTAPVAAPPSKTKTVAILVRDYPEVRQVYPFQGSSECACGVGGGM